jgi:hypothetical protein
VWLETVDPGSAAEHQRREGRNCCKYAPHRFNPPSEIEVALEVDWTSALLKGLSERILDGNSTEMTRGAPVRGRYHRRPWGAGLDARCLSCCLPLGRNDDRPKSATGDRSTANRRPNFRD